MRNRLRLFKVVTLTFLFCSNSGAFVVIENYGNWRTLSIDSKSAYMTGLWDGYLVYTGDDVVKKKFKTICGSGAIIRVSDLLEIIDSLYEKEINRNFSPADLLKDRGLEHLCRN